MHDIQRGVRGLRELATREEEHENPELAAVLRAAAGTIEALTNEAEAAALVIEALKAERGWEYGLEDAAWGVKRTGSRGLMEEYQKIHGGRVRRRLAPGPWQPVEGGGDEW